MSKVAVFGMGYVGCVTAACFARDGHEVIGVDVEADKVETVNRGETPVSEPGLDELLRQQVKTGRLRATTDVAAAIKASDLGLIAVGTPSAEDGAVSTRAVEGVIGTIGGVLKATKKNYGVVVRSTLLPGVIEERLAPLLAETCGEALGPRVWLANNPEFLRESSAIKDYDHPPYVLVGAEKKEWGDAVFELYGKVAAEQIMVDTRTAAFVKYVCNAFHALKVAFANEMGTLAKSLGADGCKIMDLVCRDTKLNISPAYMRPGFAFGGSCLPKDVRALARYAQQSAIRTDLLSSILPSNETHLYRAVRMVQDLGKKQVGVIGLSFKAGTDDLRESPYVILAETLLGKGYQIKIYDPGVAVTRLRGRNLAYVDRHLPHLAALLTDDLNDFFAHAETLVLCTNVADGTDWKNRKRGPAIDLRRDLAVPKEAGE